MLSVGVAEAGASVAFGASDGVEFEGLFEQPQQNTPMTKIINNMRTLFFIAGLLSCAVIISYEYEMPLHILVVNLDYFFSIFTHFSQIFPLHTHKCHEITLYYALFAFETQGKPSPVMMYYPLQKGERRTARHSPILPFQENCPETSMSPTIVRQPHRFHGF